MAAHVTTITVAVGDGTEIVLKPVRPWGDNPLFYASQIDAQLDELKIQYRKAMEGLYGPQTMDKS